MFGTVERGPKNTRFRLEVTMENGCQIFQVIIVSNLELERYPGLYGFTLDKMTDKLEERLNERFQSWMRR